ncbi:hypothetical protein LJR290_003443 [Variovorax sp. LjRoot290]|uniref:hypothetical protein n=1 Tax=Variovorax sp. LjRoot290 TaxID=3342316 RepID=UPI003ECDB7C0
MSRNTENRPSFAQLARRYLGTLNEYRDAKAAVSVAERIGHDVRDLEYHAAQAHARHQEAFGELVRLAVRLDETGALV